MSRIESTEIIIYMYNVIFMHSTSCVAHISVCTHWSCILGHVSCNFLTWLAFYILFELCIFYLLLRSAATNVTCFNALALSLALTHTQTQRRSGWFLSCCCCRCRRFFVLFFFFAVNTAASSLLSLSTCLFRTLVSQCMRAWALIRIIANVCSFVTWYVCDCL